MSTCAAGRRLALLAATAAIASADAAARDATGGPVTSRSPSSTPVRTGGTVVFGQDQEPRVLNGWIGEGVLLATREVVAALQDDGLRYDDRGRLVPMLLAGPPRIVARKPMTVRFAYKRSARWNDGRAITAADFRFTWQTVMARDGDGFRWNVFSRLGWEDIRAVRGEGKEVTVVFARPSAIWQLLVGAPPLPAHALRGEDFNAVWRNDMDNPKTGRPINAGPYVLQSWQRGQQLTLVRNPRYYGRKAYLAALVYRFVPSTATQFQALRAGELHVLRPQFQPHIRGIMRDRRFRVQHGPEYRSELLAFQQGPGGHPALRRRFVRLAIATAVNRRQIATALYRPVIDDLPVLDSVMFANFDRRYRPAWSAIRFNQQRAIDILRRGGCTGGPARPRPGSRELYSCPGVGRLSFRYTTNLGANLRRNLMFQIIETQLRSVGIEVVADPVASLQPRIGSGNWDIANYGSTGGPLIHLLSANLYGCDGRAPRPLNTSRYCNGTVTRLLDRAARTLGEASQVALVRRADRLLARDVPVLPLHAEPGFAIHRTDVHGVRRNPTSATLFWNAGSWWLR